MIQPPEILHCALMRQTLSENHSAPLLRYNHFLGKDSKWRGEEDRCLPTVSVVMVPHLGKLGGGQCPQLLKTPV